MSMLALYLFILFLINIYIFVQRKLEKNIQEYNKLEISTVFYMPFIISTVPVICAYALDFRIQKMSISLTQNETYIVWGGMFTTVMLQAYIVYNFYSKFVDNNLVLVGEKDRRLLSNTVLFLAIASAPAFMVFMYMVNILQG